jgi:serine/threonine-protein kinase
MVTKQPPVAPGPPAYRPPTRGYYYEEPPRRSVWPWIVVGLLILAAGGAVWLAWGKIQDELNKNEAVPVPNVVGIKEILAVRKLRESGLTVTAGNGGESSIKRVPNPTVPEGVVISQDPQAGDKVPKGKLVSLQVSRGAPSATVPDVRGKSQIDAIDQLVSRGLGAKAFNVPSSKPQGTVVAQDPPPGKSVPAKTTVRINVSTGPEQVGVPNVVGKLFEDAQNELQNAGFAVARQPVDSNEQKDVVIAQNPLGNSVSSKGAKVTLSVSKGPTAVEVPDVTGLDENSAIQQLQGDGFVVQSRDRPTSDGAEDGNVVEQRPAALSKVKPGSTVTIYIGRFQEQTTTTTTSSSTTTTAPTP